MTRIAFAADIHVGNHKRHGGPIVAGMNDRCRLVIATLRRAVELAEQRQCERLYVLGDLFDTVRPEPQVITAVQNALRGGLEIRLLMGNHDQVSTTKNDHALGPLEAVGGVDVIDETELHGFGGDIEIIAVPFRPGPAAEWFPPAVEEMAAHLSTRSDQWIGRLLVFHLGIEDEHTQAFLKGAHDSIPKDTVAQLMSKLDIDVALAGNWHSHRTWNARSIIQVGTLCPTGWDNPGFEGYGRVAIYDSQFRKVTFEEIPGPRFSIAKSDGDIEEAMAHVAERNRVYVRDEYGYGGAPLEGLAARELSVGQADVKSAARMAAGAARSATTLDEALANFVEEMPLEEGVDRAAVLGRVKGYLSK